MQNIKTDTNTKKSCLECDKDGTGLFICDGCQNFFCVEHVLKHRQNLIVQLDIIGQERDHIQRDLNEKSLSHPVIDWIDKWEENLIDKIKQAANLARHKLRPLDHHRNDALKMSFNQFTEELYSARQANNYSEIQLTKWTKKLTEFREELNTLLAVRAINDETIPPIHLIKIEHIEPVTNLDDEEEELNTDRFKMPTAGPVSLSDEDHLATYTGGVFGGYASVRSLEQYSSNTHLLRFRIESKSDNPIFLGIVSALEPFIPRTYKSPSAYGWRDINFTVSKSVSIDKSTKKEGRIFQSGDEIILTLDCDNGSLAFMHKRTMVYDNLEIDLQACPLPWRIAVSMVGMNDRVRIF